MAASMCVDVEVREEIVDCGVFQQALDELNVATSREIDSLKPLQVEALKKAVDGDCFVSLKTGYGKSLIFELLPYHLKSIIVIVCPLDVIVNQFVDRFIGAIKIDDAEKEDLTDIKYLIGHPESVTTKENCLLLKNLKHKISHIVVDEAHCVATWGHGDAEQDAFRKAFAELRVVRSILPDVKVLALTATATTAIRKKVCESLFLGANFPLTTVIDSPDREGVFLEVRQRLGTGGKHSALDSYRSVLEPLFKELRKNPDNFPKTIVYLPLVWCGVAHKLALHFLPEQLQSRVAQYHAPQTKSLKQVIPNALSNGEVLLVFATEAFGMGADVKDIRRIMHITCPSGVETYLQEIGRAGRDGKGGRAILYVNASDKANKRVSQEMKDYCTTNSCRRATLLAHFDSQAFQTNPHKCCDNCLLLCECNECEVSEGAGVIKEAAPQVSRSKLAAATALLSNYFAGENSAVTDSLFPEAVTGLSKSLAIELVEQIVRHGKDINSVLLEYRNLRSSYLLNISAIFQHINLDYTEQS